MARLASQLAFPNGKLNRFEIIETATYYHATRAFYSHLRKKTSGTFLPRHGYFRKIKIKSGDFTESRDESFAVVDRRAILNVFEMLNFV